MLLGNPLVLQLQRLSGNLLLHATDNHQRRVVNGHKAVNHHHTDGRNKKDKQDDADNLKKLLHEILLNKKEFEGKKKSKNNFGAEGEFPTALEFFI